MRASELEIAENVIKRVVRRYSSACARYGIDTRDLAQEARLAVLRNEIGWSPAQGPLEAFLVTIVVRVVAKEVARLRSPVPLRGDPSVLLGTRASSLSARRNDNDGGGAGKWREPEERLSYNHTPDKTERARLVQERLIEKFGCSAPQIMLLVNGDMTATELASRDGYTPSYAARKVRKLHTELQQDEFLRWLWEEAE